MKRTTARNAKSLYARTTSTITSSNAGLTGRTPAPTAPVGRPANTAGAPTAVPDPTAILLGIAEQMQAFATGLADAHKAQAELKLALEVKSTETAQAIADVKAEAAAESRITILKLQQQLEFHSQAAYVFKRDGNEAQYVWNCKVLNLLTQAATEFEEGNFELGKEYLQKAMKEIGVRNKHVKMADRSPAGWGLIREYLADSLADDDSDEKKIKRCEEAALSKRKRKFEDTSQRGGKAKGKGRGKPAEAAGSEAAAAATPGVAGTVDPFTWFIQNAAQYTHPAETTANTRKLGPCYLCKGPHLQKHCPVVKAQNAAIQAHLAAAVAQAPGNSN